MIVAPLEKERIVISRLVFIFMFIFLLFRFFLHITPSHLLQPSLFILNFDFSYWAYKFSGLPNLIIYNNTGVVFFDICLFLFCFLCIVFPLKQIFVVPFGFLFLIYAITYNTFIVHHAHPLAVMMLITLPFWVKRNQSWKLLWEGMRYYICYIYTMSFIWKVFLGSTFWYWDQGIITTKYNLVEYIYHNPATAMTSIYKFFIAHPQLLNAGNILIILLEGLMVIGFFTKRYDRYLLFLPVIIHLSTYFFSDVFFIEWLVLIFVFFTKKDVDIITKRFPVLLKSFRHA